MVPCCVDGSCLAVDTATCAFYSGSLAKDGPACGPKSCGPGAACGNGTVEVGEQCDDGNLETNDGCNPFCQYEVAFCGDGVITYPEQCDDGDTIGGPDCDDQCQKPNPCGPTDCPGYCGNALIEPPEECDDGNGFQGDGCYGCLVEKCPNGFLDPGEACDDGNFMANDGCDPQCQAEYVCGNGLLEPGEGCEDGNIEVGDGCDATCQPETCQPGDCSYAKTGCLVGLCEPVSGECVQYADPNVCDDFDPCSTDECDSVTGACTHVSFFCDDANACTYDTCMPGIGCSHAPHYCEDGDLCTSQECDPASGCKTTKYTDCNDANACTDDSCRAELGCQYAPVTCYDGNVCTTDSCDVYYGCLYLESWHDLCDDLDPCTVDSCDAVFGCLHVFDEDLCQVDLDVDSDNKNGLERSDAEDGIEAAAPGKFICLNDDDDNADDVIDLDTEPLSKVEDDVVPAVAEIAPLPCPAGGKWKLTFGGQLDVYSDLATRVVSAKVYDCPLAPNPLKLLVEGVVNSATPGDASMVFTADWTGDGTWDASDTVVATVVQVDLDVDSDNNSAAADRGPARDKKEDGMEANPKREGRLLPVNVDDDDDDDVGDFADGFNADGKAGNADDATAGENDLVAAVLELSAALDPGKAKIKVEYSASNPAGMTLGGAPPAWTPADGRLRLWTKSGPRNKKSVVDAGDFVPSATFPASKLFGTARKVTLYMEAVRPSTGLGTDTIQVSVDPDGDGPLPFVCADLVRVTAVLVELTETRPAFLPRNTNATTHAAKVIPAAMKGKLLFTYSHVSTFPGDAMNRGTQTVADKDLTIKAAGNAAFTVAAGGQSATTKAAVATATLKTTALDFGAMGRLRATLVGLGATSAVRRVPRDTDRDTLPDAYEDAQVGLRKDNRDSDGDGTPDGEEDDDGLRAVVVGAGPANHPASQTALGLRGDGLVAFEEYRGFNVDATFLRTETNRKNVFIRVDANVALFGTAVGGGYFPNLTGFEVHVIRATEFQSAATRAINWQRTGIPAATLQRALHGQRDDTLGFFGIADVIPGNPFNQTPNESLRLRIDVDDHDFEPFGDDAVAGLTFTTGPDGVAETLAAASDVQVIPVGQGSPNSRCINGNGDGISALTVRGGDDILEAGAAHINSGPNGLCQSARGGNDIQSIPRGLGLPGQVMIRAGADGTLDTLNGFTAGVDGNLCTADDVQVALTNAQKLDALRESVGHEAGHGVHAEHNFCFGELILILPGRGLPNAAAIRSGPDGLCQTGTAGDDVQKIPVGQGEADSVCVNGGGDGLDDGFALVGDDGVDGERITSGANGICETTATGNDAQTLPVGQGVPATLCIDNGPDGTTNSVLAGDDVDRIPLGQGEPNAICIRENGGGGFNVARGGDDVLNAATIDAGANGICQSRTGGVGPAGNVPTVMTSNIVVPIPNTYGGDDLDQVRFHLKHP